MRAYVFPGQGAQFVGMGKDLYDNDLKAKELFEKANTVLGFRITDVMFGGTDEDLKQTEITQPAIFLHSVIAYMMAENLPLPDMVAGHSLGEFSALVANRTLAFEDGLRLVFKRAKAMQKSCEDHPSTMAAVLKFDIPTIEKVCASVTDDVVVTANYNSPQQVVISGTLEGIERAKVLLREAGARRILDLNVGGAFHSPLMLTAQQELAAAIEATDFHTPICPIYQNISAKGTTDLAVIKQNLKDQLTHPVRWTQSVQNMVADGADQFTEFGPGEVLTGLIKRIAPQIDKP